MEFIKFRASEYSRTFWLEWLLRAQHEQARYHLYGIYHYTKRPDITRLQNALQAVVDNNYNLRSNFIEENNELLQIIHNKVTVKLNVITAGSKQEYDDLLMQCVTMPFDLAQEPLFRFNLIINATNKLSTFVPVFHHIITDGTQHDKLMGQIADYYHAIPSSCTTDKNDIINLQSYIDWEKQQIDKADVLYWVQKLAKFPLRVDLRPRSDVSKNILREVSKLYQLDHQLYERLKLFSENVDCSIFHILKIVFALLLSEYSRQDKVVVAYPFNTRSKDFKEVKGAHLNTWLYDFERIGSFQECLEKHKREREHSHNKYISITKIISSLQSMDKTFSVSISQAQLLIKGPILDVEPTYTFKLPTTTNDLQFIYNTDQGGLQYGLVSHMHLFDEISLDLFSHHFCILLSKVIDSPEVDLTQITCINSEEYNQIIYEWNKTEKSYLDRQTICQLFEKQAAKTPSEIAVVFQESKLTYEELNNSSNHLARYIRSVYKQITEQSLSADTLIPICTDTGLDMIIGILGILKAGAAYVPIEHESSSDHIKLMLEECSCEMMLTSSGICEKISKVDQLLPKIILDELFNFLAPATNLKNNILDKHLAYVVYTEVSAEEHKGIMVEHKSVVNTLGALNAIYKIAPSKKVTLFYNCIYETSVAEVFVTLLNGGELHVLGEELKNDIYKLAQYIDINNIEISCLPADILSLLPKLEYPNLKTIISSGTSCDESVMQHWINNYNLYHYHGHPEAAIYFSCGNVTETKNNKIGKPLTHIKSYILNKKLQPVPKGVVGELYIAGSCLARAYLNDPKLTEEHFIANSFITEQDNEEGYGRLYKTRDLARWLPDGQFEFIRCDDRKSLASSDHLSADSKHEPSTIEQIICDIWSETLSNEISTTEVSFFNLGGDSLSIVKVRSQLEEKFSIRINMVSLFQHNTVKTLSQHIQNLLLAKNDQTQLELTKWHII